MFLFASTAVHMGALVWNTVATHTIVLDATRGLSSATYDGHESLAAFENAVFARSWMITVALATNVSVKVMVILYYTVSTTRRLNANARFRSRSEMPSYGGAPMPSGRATWS